MPRYDHRAKTVEQTMPGQDLYRLVLEVIVDELNELRESLQLPPRTVQQVLHSLRQRRKAQQKGDG